VNLGVIDSSLKRVASDLRTLRTTIDVSQSRLDAAKETRKELKFVLEMREELAALTALQEETENYEQPLASLSRLVKSAGVLSEEAKIEIPSFLEVEQAKEAHRLDLLDLELMERLYAELGVAFTKKERLEHEHSRLHKALHSEFNGAECPTCQGKGHL
jgi:hypothetical protein